MSVRVQFLPDDITVTAEVGEPILEVAKRANVFIATGCLMGSCHACEVEMEDGETICACLNAIPGGRSHITINIYTDLTW